MQHSKCKLTHSLCSLQIVRQRVCWTNPAAARLQLQTISIPNITQWGPVRSHTLIQHNDGDVNFQLQLQKRKNHQDCSVVGFYMTAVVMKINSKKTQAGGKASGLTHATTGRLMLATKCFIHITIWPFFLPHFTNWCPLSCPRTASEPENTQIGEKGGGREAEHLAFHLTFLEPKERKIESVMKCFLLSSKFRHCCLRFIMRSGFRQP